MVDRKQELETLRKLLTRHPVVGIIGARQVGKTTLARMLAAKTKGATSSFDLENPEDLARLGDPMLALKELKGLIIIDEIQRLPGLFEVIRVLVDRPRSTTRFLVLGSASPGLLHQSSETLAGRIAYHELGGFSVDEIGIENYKQLWLRGGFPRSYLARSLAESDEWRHNFIRTFLERDLPQLGITIHSNTLRRFWTMLAHYHGQIWNASEFGRAFGVADSTVRRYLDMLTSALVIRQLQPWYENISKRQVKAPKIYLIDSGIMHTLLNLKTPTDLEGHPKVGASWEGFVLEQVIRRLGAKPEECFFWATHGGAELDLLVIHGQQRLGFEVKRNSAPRLTPSMQSALADLKLHRLDVIHAGEHTFPLEKRVRAISFSRLLEDLKPLR
ncbi:MAG: ATP-binding protein [candidate division KSB1 bacterium]|nr:ATP-binding protein [candidate division KSB1 bacterium]MDZ7365675.1 ATP-binding protein [candidate division KSB1 bacterium]MDZ7403249.1 ATP-binding protein [candidate division KSB1 bacterium]